MIIKFGKYNDPRKKFLSKKKLKGSRISITESLTFLRMAKLISAMQQFAISGQLTAGFILPQVLKILKLNTVKSF